MNALGVDSQPSGWRKDAWDARHGDDVHAGMCISPQHHDELVDPIQPPCPFSTWNDGRSVGRLRPSCGPLKMIGWKRRRGEVAGCGVIASALPVHDVCCRRYHRAARDRGHRSEHPDQVPPATVKVSTITTRRRRTLQLAPP